MGSFTPLPWASMGSAVAIRNGDGHRGFSSPATEEPSNQLYLHNPYCTYPPKGCASDGVYAGYSRFSARAIMAIRSNEHRSWVTHSLSRSDEKSAWSPLASNTANRAHLFGGCHRVVEIKLVWERLPPSQTRRSSRHRRSLRDWPPRPMMPRSRKDHQFRVIR